jgi:hypothetical protein
LDLWVLAARTEALAVIHLQHPDPLPNEPFVWRKD